MLSNYVRVLEERDIYDKTGQIWRIQDVPVLWRSKVRAKVFADGYIILEDGTVAKPVEEEPVQEEPSEEQTEEEVEEDDGV